MAEDVTKEPAVVRPVVADLSRELEQSLERKPDERIKAVKLFDDYYRCNWWVETKAPHAFWLGSGTIIKSRFLRATRKGEGLLIGE